MGEELEPQTPAIIIHPQDRRPWTSAESNHRLLLGQFTVRLLIEALFYVISSALSMESELMLEINDVRFTRSAHERNEWKFLSMISYRRHSSDVVTETRAAFHSRPGEKRRMDEMLFR